VLIDSLENKRKILEIFLEICGFEGWSEETLFDAVEKCGFNRNQTPLIFENTIFDLTNFYIEENNRNSTKLIADMNDFLALKIRQKVAILLFNRFLVEKENKLQLQALFNFYASLDNIKSFNHAMRPMSIALKNCCQIADFIWREIGDNSTDFNYYTKRLTLSKIILRSLWVFMKDNSDDLSQTRKIIDKEIEKVMKFEKTKAKVKEIFKETFLNEENNLKSLRNIVDDLPFIRLIKKK